MSNENLYNDKEITPGNLDQAPSQNQKPEPRWTDRLDACLTDEFRHQLAKTLNNNLWCEVQHGAWNDKIDFFKYLDEQVEIVYQLKASPSLLKNHFQLINPSLQPYPQGGEASRVARENLPVIRQQVFLINSLLIIIKKRFESDQSLRLAFTELNDLLHGKIIETLRSFGSMMRNPEWHYLTNRVEQYSDLRDKAEVIKAYLGEIIEKNNIKRNDDKRDTLLFMKEQLEIPYEVIVQNNNQIRTAFGNNESLKNFCANLYYEYFRLIALASLEGLQQNEPATDLEDLQQNVLTNAAQTQLQETSDLPNDAVIKGNKHKDLTLERATLFLSYLLDFAKDKSRENHGLKNKKRLADADKDRIINFLTPYSGSQSKKLHKRFKDEIIKIEEKEVSEKFYEHMQVIRKYFEMLGLSEITKRIDTDLGEN